MTPRTSHEHGPRVVALDIATRHGESIDRYLPCVSPAMGDLAARVARVAASEAPVVIFGETGCGKTTLAQQLHEDSPRRATPLVTLHAATATAEMVATLTHHSGHTIVVEEIGDLAPAAQAAMVRVMGEVGSAVRFIATTSRDLGDLAARRVLRVDLIYRVDVVRLEIPPLRQRPEDIVFLAEHFLAVAARHFRRDLGGINPEARTALLAHAWLGNVRELRNCLFESVLYCAHRTLRVPDLRFRTSSATADPRRALVALLPRLHAAHPEHFYDVLQQLVLAWAIELCEGNRSRAAALLGVGRGSLRVKLRRYKRDVPVNGAATRS